MSLARPRPGLSFELAPPVASHPLRTDIACLVGTVARRRQRSAQWSGDGLAVLPPVLVRWLQAQGFQRLGGVPLALHRASLASASALRDSLVARAGSDAERSGWADFLAPYLGAGPRQAALEALLAACRTLTPVPDAVIEDLRQRGFYPRQMLGPDELAGWLRIQRLHNLPVRLDAFDAFDLLFAWDERPVMQAEVRLGDPVVATALGAALRAFFGEGGQLAYVVRTGDPSAVFDDAATRFAACFPAGAGDDRCTQLTGVRAIPRPDGTIDTAAESLPANLSPREWVGLEHVFGLPDVSFALMPDLVGACALTLPHETPPPAEVVAAEERFVDCADPAAAPPQASGRRMPPPRSGPVGLDAWRKLVLRALGLLDNGGRAFHRRDVELLASLPLATPGLGQPDGERWLGWMASHAGWMTADAAGALASDRLQLAYPWVRSRDSADCPGGLEAPEGMLAGVLARSALERGAYRSAATQPLRRFIDTEPEMVWTPALQQVLWTPLGAMSFAERVSLLGPSPRGPVLLCDTTCSDDARTRQAAVRRLVNVVVQAARNAGDEFAFDPNGEILWARVRERLSDLMRTLAAAGALSTDGRPFDVRCGRETMRQADIDSGRLIAEIELQPAQPIQRIVVVLNLRDAGTGSNLAAAA